MPANRSTAKSQHAYPIEPASRLATAPSKPRASIDDDNVEGDADLTSSLADVDLLSNSSSGVGGGFASDNFDDDDDDDDDDEYNDNYDNVESPTGSASRRPLSATSSSSFLIPAPPNAFAPPFYNRPPTPLPPSPSLTSLLRPSFSSRPTTPDDSESEVAAMATAGEGSATEAAAVAKSARDARSVPRASPKVPTYEYYGFVLYLTSGLCFLMYLLWSYLPSPFLHQLGIYYYPNRWWSLAVPSFLVMLLVYIYVALAAYNTEYLTPSLGSIMNVVDEAANVAALRSRNLRGKGSSSGAYNTDKKARGSSRAMRMTSTGDAARSASLVESVDWKEIWNEGTDAVMDIPIGGVCEVLYGMD